MRVSILPVLRCPLSGERLSALDLLTGVWSSPDQAATGEISEGVLVTPSSRMYPVRGGVPRLLAGGLGESPGFVARHAEALRRYGLHPDASPRGRVADGERHVRAMRRQFERQWAWWGDEHRLYGRTLEDMEVLVRDGYAGPGLDAAWLPGKRVLDAGCGHGAFTRAFGRLGAETYGLELGFGVEKAVDICRDTGSVQLLQGDILKPPFAEGTFDLVFCHGVLPFVPRPEAGFAALARLVKPGGSFRIWVYPRASSLWEATQRSLRSLTSRLPPRLLYYLCFVPVPLLSVVKTYSGTSLRNSSWRQCAQVVWDYYSCSTQWHLSEDDILVWYSRAGFERPQFLDIPLSAVGRKRS